MESPRYINATMSVTLRMFALRHWTIIAYGNDP